MANIRDLAIGQVATAPSPATTGTTLTLNTGQGADMPTTTPFKVLAYPSNALPTKSNSEILLVTGVSGDTLTFLRAQGETSTAKTIAVGWLISNNIFTSDINNTSFVKNEVPVGTINGTNAAFTVASPYVTNTLRVYKNGVRQQRGASNDFTESASGFMMTTAPAVGSVLLVDYEVGSGAYAVGTNSIISDETPTGTINGSNTVFTTARPYIASSLEVHINGLKQYRVTDFTETTPGSGTFTMLTAPATGDAVRVNYQYNLNPASNADTVDGFHASSTPTAGNLLPLNTRSQSGEWWEELGRTTLGVTGSTISVTNFTSKKYLRIQLYTIGTGIISQIIRFNNDSAANYAYRTSTNGGADAATASASQISITNGDSNNTCLVTADIINATTTEKFMQGLVNLAPAGAASIPPRVEFAAKWANTAAQINRIDIVNTNTGSFAIGSELIILGHD